MHVWWVCVNVCVRACGREKKKEKVSTYRKKCSFLKKKSIKLIFNWTINFSPRNRMTLFLCKWDQIFLVTVSFRYEVFIIINLYQGTCTVFKNCPFLTRFFFIHKSQVSNSWLLKRPELIITRINHMLVSEIKYYQY